MSLKIEDAQLILTSFGAAMSALSLLSQTRQMPALDITYVTCPNCGQLFDISRFPVIDRKRRPVSCPRCWYTWEL